MPISLDITVDGVHLRDAFRWNLHDRHTTPDAFAAVLCSDLSLPPGFHVRVAVFATADASPSPVLPGACTCRVALCHPS